MAWQSIKKLFPASCECMNRPLVEKLVEGLRQPRRILPPGYLRFVARESALLFKKGWDLGYEPEVLQTSPPVSSTIESTRSQGGALGTEFDHESFINEALRGPSRPGRAPPEAQLMVVQSAGKPRPLTKFSADELLLRPLHRTMYNHLSKNRWLSRGDVSAEALDKAGFSPSPGDVLTSGDYKSATDQLSIEVAEVIVDASLRSSTVVPPSVRERAAAILRPHLFVLDPPNGPPCSPRTEVGAPRVGQMMGSYLSFPLLCIQNRIAFLWAMVSSGMSIGEARRVPCLINGDDILFCSSPSVSDVWMSTVGSLGLEVEQTKTSVDVEWCSLNSTLLRLVGGHLRVVPTLRFGRLRQSEFVNSLGREFSLYLRGFTSNLRFRAGIVWFRAHLRSLRSTKLTLHELGFRGKLAMRLGILFSLPLCAEEGVGVPPAPVGHNVVLSSDDFVRVPTDELTEEVREVGAREVVSWKYSLSYRECRVSAALQYCLALSRVRRTQPVCGPIFVRESGCFWSGRRLSGWNGLKNRFLETREVGVRTSALAVRLVSDQPYGEWDVPPPYGAENGGAVGVASCFSKQDLVDPKKE